MAKKGETTSKPVGTKASSVLRSPDTGSKSKAAAGSALAWHARGQGFESPYLHFNLF